MSERDVTYPEIGATRDDGPLPPGYRHVVRRERIGDGPEVFRRAAAVLRAWDVQRGAGLRVAPTPPPAVGVRVTSWAGPLRIPCQVVWVVDDDRRYGYGYGTLPGHPESGEEAFVVSRDGDDRVWFDIRAFSRPARWYTRLGGPLAHLAQDLATARYVAVVRKRAAAPG